MTQRYDTYKDSGVQWLGEIPGHWGCVRMKYLVSFINGYAFDSKKFLNEGEVAVYRISDIQNDCISSDNCVYVSHDDKFSDFEIQDNDLLIAMSGATTGKTGLVSGQRGYINQRVGIIRSNYIHYIKYGLRMLMFLDYIFLLAEGSAQPNISANGICQYRLPLPPLSEQRSIVSFLDAKCGKIDEWVNKKQKEVEHLQELKQRVIADAVTRGLNPHVKMKATNIPWLKEIPEHWDCAKLKMFCQDNKEKNKGNIESCVLSLSYGNIIVKKNINFGLVPENYESYQIVNPGNIILRLTDLQNDHKSLRTGLVKNRGIITSAYVGLIVKNMNSEYTQLILHSYDVMKVFYGMGGGLRQSMSYTDIANVYIPVPPLSEQEQIVSYLDSKTSKIDKLIANVTKEIERIKEYKQRLISDVVTGQIKVC